MRKKLLIISHEWPDYIGGVGLVGYNLASELRLKHDVVVLSRRIPQFRKLSGVKHKFVPDIRFFWVVFYMIFLLRYHRRYDFIVLNEAAPVVCAGLALSKYILSTKCVALLHGLEIDHFYSNLKISKFLRYAHERAVRNSKDRVFVSRFYRKRYVRHVPSLIQSACKVIYPVFLSDPVLDRCNDKNLSELLRFITVSRLDKNKGFYNLLPILNHLEENKIDYQWTIVGEGKDRQIIEKMFENYSKVRLVGAATQKELAGWYCSADIFVQLSDYYETFGLVYTEAQSWGLYCIAARRGATDESIAKGNGFLVETAKIEPSAIIQEIINRPKKSKIQRALWEKFGQECEKWVRLFDNE
jgi:L-malate glycosyltransferase